MLSSTWSKGSRLLHWLTVLLIAIQLPVGFWMVEVYEVYAETYADDTWVMRSSWMHHTLGFILLALIFTRIGWRWSHPAPGLPAKVALWQRRLSRLNHALLYVLLVIYPLSGWAALSAYEGEFPIFFLGWDDVFRIVPQVAETARFNYEFFAIIHRSCWRAGAALIVLHVGAAVWHQFVLRDGVLRRMWSGKS